jgi:type VI secretion system protein ImpG
VDARAAPFSADVRQLGLSALCTNRDLPIRMPHGVGPSDFELDLNAPVTAIRLLQKTDPVVSHAHGETAWRAISHLSLNYLSLVDEPQTGAAALRSLLALYGDPGRLDVRRRIEGVISVGSRPVVRRIVREGRIAFVRGLEVTVAMREEAFEGASVFLLGAVLEKFFAKYVTINSFTETVIRTEQRGEVMRWPAQLGTRHVS